MDFMSIAQSIFEHGFYFAGLVFFIYEFYVLYFYKTYQLKPDESLKSVNAKTVFISYFLWMVIGIYSSQWIFFVLLSILSLLDMKRNDFLRILDFVLSVILIFAIVFNKYIYRYDLDSLHILFKLINIRL